MAVDHLSMTGQTILIEFFGTGQKNLVRPNSVRHFDINTVLPLLNRKRYRKAMKELEISVKSAIGKHLGRNFKPETLIADGADPIRNAFYESYDSAQLDVMCYAHVIRNCHKLD